MFWSLVTALFAGFAGAGIGLILRALSRKRLPAGVVPVCAGLTMLVSTVALEYQWAEGVRGSMPEDLVIVSTREQQAWYQPWTYVQPWVRGFMSFSPSESVETSAGSDIYAVQLRIQERWQPQMVRPALVDCANTRWSDITPDTTFTDAGQPVDVRWLEQLPGFPIVDAVCSGEAAGD